MAKQNRVTPFGDIIATSARGSFMGNRGILHNERQEIVRPYAHKAWIICRLAFKERRSEIMAPGHYTQLFFFDEPTALAAGHRPCFECQRRRAQQFRDVWMAANSQMNDGRSLKMSQIDQVLHGERLTQAYLAKDRHKRTFIENVANLPNGTFVIWRERPCLVWDSKIVPWTAAGYDSPLGRPSQGKVTVLTPASIVRTLAAGFETIPRGL